MSLNISINIINSIFWQLDYQDPNARWKTDGFSNACFYTSVNLLIEASLIEIKPVVAEKCKFEDRWIFLTLRIFGLSGF